MQSFRVRVDGLTVMGGGGAGQIPAPSPVAATAIVIEEFWSATSTDPPPKAPDGLVRRIVTELPKIPTEAVSELVLGVAVTVPDPPESETVTELLQSRRVTEFGFADRPPPPHEPAPVPVA